MYGVSENSYRYFSGCVWIWATVYRGKEWTYKETINKACKQKQIFLTIDFLTMDFRHNPTLSVKQRVNEQHYMMEHLNHVLISRENFIYIYIYIYILQQFCLLSLLSMYNINLNKSACYRDFNISERTKKRM